MTRNDINTVVATMPVPPDSTEVPLIWVALGGLASACAGAFSLLWSAVSGVRREGNDGRKQIWDRLTALGDRDANWREDNAKHAVTREDMAEFRDELEELIENRFKLQESRMADMVRFEIDNRKPLGGA
ncbi:MAG: hypothetical protein KGJ13_08170 [Patescibacteria group bacterium]|nr:hypothetical protein [Patescibacteria group bacterium]